MKKYTFENRHVLYFHGHDQCNYYVDATLQYSIKLTIMRCSSNGCWKGLEILNLGNKVAMLNQKK